MLSKGKNISNNQGYDNQPSFYNDNIVLFASTKNGQTDIAKFNIKKTSLEYLSDTPNGSEYSPLKIPGENAISAIRLDNDGKQLLYRYNFKSDKYNQLIDTLIIGYHVWLDKDRLASFVLGDTTSLVLSNLKTNSNKVLDKNIGRSLHKIPDTELFSYISKKGNQWTINSINPKTFESKKIINTIPQVEDMCWLNDGTILMPKGNTIYQYNPKLSKDWFVFKKFNDANLQNISRITTNRTGTLLCLVSEASPETVVQKQLEAYNAKDIDAFMETFSDDIKLYNFPKELRSEGHTAMYNSYKSFFENTPDLNCKILKRIVIGNKVIDHELVKTNGNTFKAVAIYEIENGLITKVTFIQ